MRRILITGVTAAAILGAGTGALAVSGTNDTSGSPSSGSSSSQHGASQHGASKHGSKAHQRKHALARALRGHSVHGQIVTKGKNGYVRHDGVTGTVTAVSATSIAVKASDGYTETFTVDGTTHVRKRTDGKGAKSAISAVHTGDTVAVLGAAKGGHGAATARIVMDGVKK